MNIVIATRGLDFNGNSLKEGSLGGSETAVVYMAQELHNLGHNVSVFCPCSRPGDYDGVQYFNIDSLEAHMRCVHPDVFIASRWTELLISGFRAGLRVLWNHDMPFDKKRALAAAWPADIAFVLSEYQRQQYEEKIHELSSIVRVTRNGLGELLRDVEYEVDIDNKTVLYTSRPERGLLALLSEVMPRVWKQVPEAVLKVATYCNDLDPSTEAGMIHAECNRLMQQHGDRVVQLGGLTKEKLYEEMRKAAVLAYPTQWPEISCLTCMESQACGLPFLTTDDFALSETANPSCLVGKFDETYVDKFVGQLVAVLNDADLRQKMSEAGQKHVAEKKYFWTDIAKEWSDMFESELQSRVASNPQGIVDSLICANEYGVAEIVAKQHNLEVDRDVVYEMQLDETRINESRQTFDTVSSMVSHLSTKPRRILCVPSGVECQSYWLTNVLHGVDVVCMVDTPEHKQVMAGICERLGGVVSVMLREEVAKQASSENGKFDLVVLTKRMEKERNFREYTKKIQRDFLRKTGSLITINTVGEGLRSKKCDVTSYWRFGVAELQEVFKDCEASLRIVYNTLGDGADGDLYGVTVSSCQFCKSPKNIDILSRVRRCRTYKNVSLCMLVGDDRFWLPQCLEALSQYVDEIRVYDTKQSSETEDIVKSYGGTWIPGTMDNFAQARNESKLGATGDWILWVDCDERLLHPERFRKFLQTSLFNGIGVRQNHLVVDGEIPPDSPIRLFKNLEKYEFRGIVHEHPEDKERGEYDTPIEPSFILADISIAHFGYLTEEKRRTKCSRRNMQLLLRDVEENGKKGRMLTWVLVARDYVNMAKWASQKGGGKIQYGSVAHMALEASVATYWSKTRHADIYRDSAVKTYVEALELLRQSQLTYRPMNLRPFLANASIAPIPPGVTSRTYQPEVEVRPFLCREEFIDYSRMVAQERITGEPAEYGWELPCTLPEPAFILNHAPSLLIGRVRE